MWWSFWLETKSSFYQPVWCWWCWLWGVRFWDEYEDVCNCAGPFRSAEALIVFWLLNQRRLWLELLLESLQNLKHKFYRNASAETNVISTIQLSLLLIKIKGKYLPFDQTAACLNTNLNCECLVGELLAVRDSPIDARRPLGVLASHAPGAAPGVLPALVD